LMYLVFVPGDSKAGRLLDVLDDVLFAAAVAQPVGVGATTRRVVVALAVESLAKLAHS
jgi:hypothetical protein